MKSIEPLARRLINTGVETDSVSHAVSSMREYSVRPYTGKNGSSEAGGSCSKALMLNASTE